MVYTKNFALRNKTKPGCTSSPPQLSQSIFNAKKSKKRNIDVRKKLYPKLYTKGTRVFIGKDDKVFLINKPTQSGKTWTMIDMILEVMRDTPEEGGEFAIPVNFIMVSNALLQQAQLVVRLEKHVDTVVINHQSIVACASGIIGEIAQGKSTFVFCQNDTQRFNIYDTLVKIKSSQIKDRKFHIWIDEADENWSSISPFVDECNKLDNVEKTYLITATPEVLMQYYSEGVETLLLNETHLPTYVGISDHQKMSVDWKWDGPLYESVCEANGAELAPGTKWYIPSRKEKIFHVRAAQYLNSKGFNVLVVNGDGLNLYMHNGEKIFHDKESMEIFIDKIYSDYNLSTRPFAVTGFLCIGRGITLQSQGFKLTHAVIPYIDNNNSAYQCAGRCCGNFPEGFEEKIKIYCSDEMWKKLLRYESAAKKFSKRDDEDEDKNTVHRTKLDYDNAKRSFEASDDDEEREKKRQRKIFLHKYPEIAQIFLGSSELLTTATIVSALEESFWKRTLKKNFDSNSKMNKMNHILLQYKNGMVIGVHDDEIIWKVTHAETGEQIHSFGFTDKLKEEWRSYLASDESRKFPPPEYVKVFENMLQQAAACVRPNMSDLEKCRAWRNIPSDRKVGIDSNKNGHWLVMCYLFCRSGKVVEKGALELEVDEFKALFNVQKDTSIRNLTEVSNAWRRKGAHLRKDGDSFCLAWK
jgi:hypothetical protein